MRTRTNCARLNGGSGRTVRRGFNLVELLVTMAVVGTLLGLAMPAIRSISNASNLTLGSSTLSNELRRARQHAIGQNRYVAVLLPTAQPSNEGGVDDVRYRGHSFRTCYLTGKPRYDAVSKSYVGTFDGYLAASQWQFLPGSVFVAATDTNGDWNASADLNRCNSVDGLNFPDSISSTQINHLRAVIFKPNGSMVPAPTGGAPTGSSITVDIVKGELDKDNKRILASGVNHQRMEINHFTGKLDFVD